MGSSDPRAADLVLRGGRLLTMVNRPADAEAEALAVRNGRIVAVGTNRDIERLVDSTTDVVDLEGRYALPGLADCHVHLASDAGRTADSVECRDFYDPGIRTVEDLLDRLRERAASVPPGGWVIGRGSPLQDFRLRDGRLPRRAELDRAAPNHPAYVYFGAHLLIANTRAIAERGIDRDTPSPQGGVVVKDAEGNPTGEFRERAQFLIKARGAAIGPEELAERIAIELDKCSRRGVTTIHDIVTDKNEILAYQMLARDGALRVRVHLIIRVIESNFAKWSLENLGLINGFGSEWLQIGGIKMSIDGGFTGKNAAFSEPLSNDDGHEHPGLVRIQQDELDETVERYHRAGMRICTHAIGDVALDMILQSYEKAQTTYPRPDHRHRVEHMGNWMMTPERIERARRINLLPIPNPPFLYYMGDPLVEMIQGRVTDQGFGFRNMWDAGFPLTFGSDSPGYYSVDPLRDLGTAVAHQTLSGALIAPGQSLTLVEALRSQTVNAAYTGFRERTEGTLEAGKVADVAVLGDDPFSVPPERFGALPVDLTLSGGEVVYRRDSTKDGVHLG